MTNLKIADSHTDQTQRRMTNCSGHFSDLAVFSFDQLQRQPARGDCFSEANGWVARGYFGLRIEQVGRAGEGLAALNDETLFQGTQRRGIRNPLNLNPILAFMSMSWVQQPLVERGFIAEEE